VFIQSRQRALIALVGAAILISLQISAAADDYFRLATQFRGPTVNLDINNGGPHDNMPILAHGVTIRVNCGE
jgi:hypothetical protein